MYLAIFPSVSKVNSRTPEEMDVPVEESMALNDNLLTHMRYGRRALRLRPCSGLCKYTVQETTMSHNTRNPLYLCYSVQRCFGKRQSLRIRP